MPANETTWRDQKWLHVVFGVSALAMLATTVWMLAKDHTREWKGYQRKFRQIEADYAVFGQNEQRNADYDTRQRELNEQLTAAQAAPLAPGLVQEYKAALEAKPTLEGQGTIASTEPAAIDAAYAAVVDAPDDETRRQARRALVDLARADATEAMRIERNADVALKFARADLDVANSDYSLAVGAGRPPQRLAELDAKLQQQSAKVEQLKQNYQQINTYRKRLDGLVAQMTTNEASVKKQLEDHQAEIARLQSAQSEQTINPGENLVTLPIIEAFNSPLKINQIWLPDLTQPVGSFKQGARFDRCTTCHLGIDKTMAGSAVDPKYPVATEFDVLLPTPAEPPKFEPDTPPAQKLRELYGLQLATKGSVDAKDVTISGVDAGKPAATAALAPVVADAHSGTNVRELQAGLQAGDVIVQVKGAPINSVARAEEYLLNRAVWGQPLVVRVRRGVPQPYATHPRLDLFVGSLSPHTMADFGCTVCHEGQGSSTSFTYASHTPDNFREQTRWAKEYGWFNNHYWIYPMLPTRFLESSCLKCHHEPLSLVATQRFPQPPAPKLLEGYDLIKKYGCFGCHEIAGYDGPDKRIGPDLRNEPLFFAAAQQLLVDGALTPQERSLAEIVVRHPENEADRKLLSELIVADANLARAEGEEPAAPRLTSRSHQMGKLLSADDQPAGTLRRVGPSLRYIASKVEEPFLYDWIREPKHFRPTTRMPQFFGLHNHLLPKEAVENGHVVEGENAGLHQSQQLEPIEIRSLATYLLANSQPFDYPGGSPLAEPSAERGKKLFQTKGCLACHSHEEFPDAAQLAATYENPLVHAGVQGPDLSRLGAKLVGERGKQWLVSWLRQPDRYHARTVMPNLFLDLYREGETNIDPAADIAAYLLSFKDWQPDPEPALDEKALDEMVFMHLASTVTERKAREWLETGIPEAEAAERKGDELLLVAPITNEKKLQYVGRRTISKYGCTGCHDIPGFEDAKPIGTQLQAWGRKDVSQLAFEQIEQYLARTGVHGGHGAHGEASGDAHAAGHTAGEHHLPEIKDLDANVGFFLGALLSHQREGFLWQKLREPRSFDYRKTENKPFNDRYKMPQFPFDDHEREAVMTFVLGLVAEPAPARFVFNPQGREKALVEGRNVLAKYNCGGCHALEMDQWRIEFDPNSDQFAEPVPFNDYDFLKPHFTPEQLAASKKVDRRGRGHVTLHGMPKLDDEGTGLFEDVDDNDNPLYFFELWKSLPIAGHAWVMGGPEVQVSQPDIRWQKNSLGGYLAKLLFPTVLAEEKEVNPNAKASDAWGWVPPPLLREGEKVQTDWLHDFLLDPFLIRPAVVLRMPKFNMTSTEASALVDYFAAADNAPYPYVYDPRERSADLSAVEATNPQRLDSALKIVTNGDYCIKCHLLNDFVPPGSVKALAPRLDRVHKRLRPEFTRNWIANPKRLLPYTGMPVNFPPDQPVRQELFPGTSLEQLDAVVDLLMTYDEFMKGKTSVKPLIQQATTPPAEAAAAAGN